MIQANRRVLTRAYKRIKARGGNLATLNQLKEMVMALTEFYLDSIEPEDFQREISVMKYKINHLSNNPNITLTEFQELKNLILLLQC